eukprot:172914_1
MHRLLCLALCVSLISAACPDGGSFSTDASGTCVYECYDNHPTVAKAALSFNEIKFECDGVRNAARFDGCSSLSDLVWSGCSCPLCKCDSLAEGVFKTFERPVTKSCYECSCIATDSTDYIYQCNALSHVSDPYNWNDFLCDGTSCTGADGDAHYPGEGWFEDVSDGAECNKFCYCPSSGNKECQTGFANIIEKGSEKLKASFYDDCGYNIRSCWNDPERMVVTYTGPTCYSWSCPHCSCPSGKTASDTSYYVKLESQEYGAITNYEDAVSCLECTCGTYEYCDRSESYPESGPYDYECPPPRSITCHDTDYSSTSDATKSDTVQSETTYTNHPDAWCSVSLDVSDDTDDWNWDFDDSPFCGIYGRSGECFKYSYDFSYLDCSGDTETDDRTQYTWCCKTDNCNYVDGTAVIDTSTCSDAAGLSAMYLELAECVGTHILGSDDCEDESEEVTCESIVAEYRVVANCYCKAYAQIYQDAVGISEDWADWTQSQINMFMTIFSEWNEALGCTGDLTCNLKGSDGEIGVLTFSGDSSAAEYKVYMAFVSLLIVSLF